MAAQIDARACVDRTYGLPAVWSFTAPLGRSTLGVLLLDTAWRALSGRGAGRKGRRTPRQVTSGSLRVRKPAWPAP
jgi:hypothetical protein